MKKYILLTLTTLLALGVQAQHKLQIKVNLPGHTQAVYTVGDNADSIRIIEEIGVKIYTKGNTQSIDYLKSQVDYEIEYITPPVDNTNENKIQGVNDQGHHYRYTMLELPRVSNVTTDYYIQKTIDGRINYTVEWCGLKKANRWSAYQLCKADLEKNTQRKNKFYVDPDIPEQYQTTPADYKKSGYHQGHLCPSDDRISSQDLNKQTFFLSNIQPQEGGHNTGVWKILEGKVRNWARQCDTLYVVKAATIDSARFIKTYTKSNLIVPKYFFMALLSYKAATGTYEALGIWSPHAKGSETQYITIEELQHRTGLDFFCNLPDQKEKEVEQKVNESYWGVTLSAQHGVPLDEDIPTAPSEDEPEE